MERECSTYGIEEKSMQDFCGKATNKEGDYLED
jgi:hypothetical protein